MDVCWPNFSELSKIEKKNWSLVLQKLQDSPIFVQFVNLYYAWSAILFSMATAFILCIIYIYFMSIFAEYVAWALVFITQIGFFVIGVGSLYYYATAEEGNKKKGAALLFGICGTILSLLFSIALYCGWSQLKLAIEIVNCSADFLAQTKRVLFVPIVYYVFFFIFFLFWISCIISVESMGRIVPNPGNKVLYIPLDKDVKWDDRRKLGKTVNIILAFLIFGLFWITFFLQHSSNYVVMVTAATYYFTSNPSQIGSG